MEQFKKILGREDKLVDDEYSGPIEPQLIGKHGHNQPETILEENPYHEEENEGDVEFDLEPRSHDRTPESGHMMEEEKREE